MRLPKACSHGTWGVGHCAKAGFGDGNRTNVPGELIPDRQRQLLCKLDRIRVRQIGNEISRQEILDEEII